MAELKPIVLRDEDDGRVYTLRFTRATVKKMEQNGFNMNEVSSMPMTRVPELFYGAFLADQPFIKKKDTDTILFDKLGGMSDKMMERLGELYAEPFNTLVNGDNTENPQRMTVEL